VLEVDNVGAKTNLDIYLFTICKEIKERNTEIDIFEVLGKGSCKDNKFLA
jgi:hypothetical protein